MRTSHVAVVPFVVVGALVACGASTSGGGGNSASGTVSGTTFTVGSALATAIDECGSPCVPSIATLEITNRTGYTCAALNLNGANVDHLSLMLVNENGPLTT